MNENILIFSKNSCMKNLNEMIKKLNESYNQSIINIFSINKNSKNILEDKSDNNTKKEITLGCKNDSLYSDIPEIKSDESKTSIDDNNSFIDDDYVGFASYSSQICGCNRFA